MSTPSPSARGASALRRSLALALLLPLSACGGSDGGGGGGGGTAPDAPTATSATVSPATAEIESGSTREFTVEVRYSDGTTRDRTSAASWSSSDPSVASVNGSGVATGLVAGSATITASVDGRSGSAAISVQPGSVAAIPIERPDGTEFEVGETVFFNAQPSDVNGNLIEDATFTWASSDSDVATVDEYGNTTGVSVGTATLTVTSQGVTGSVEVRVVQAPVASVEIDPTPVDVPMGQTRTATAVLKNSRGQEVGDRAVEWSIDDPSIATVASDGTVTAVAMGTTTLSATSEGVTGSAAVNVGPASVVLMQPWAAVQRGQSQQLDVEVRDLDDQPVDGLEVVWESSNPSAVTVDANGVIRGVATGAADVTARVGGTSATIEVTVPSVCTQEPFGVNIAGAEFAPWDKDWHVYPPAEDLDYFASKGLRLIRVPFSWEKIQRYPGDPLYQPELDKLIRVLDDARDRDLLVLLDLHNYARFTGEDGRTRIIGDDDLPISDIVDFWTRLADVVKGRSEIWGYGVMNEPYNLRSDTPWPTIAQAIIDGIRSVDTETRIVMAGDFWSGTRAWIINNPDLHQLVDPSDNMIFEGHLYFDEQSSGTYAFDYDTEKAYPDVGVDRLKPFLEWLRETGNQGFIGEYGIPDDDERWLEVADRMLAYAQANCLNATYWAGGSAWNGEYRLGIQPRNGVERPQMSVVEKYLISN